MGFWICRHCHKENYITIKTCSCGQTCENNEVEFLAEEKIKKEEKRKQKELKAIEKAKKLLMNCNR